jgi:hypothetical protein
MGSYAVSGRLRRVGPRLIFKPSVRLDRGSYALAELQRRALVCRRGRRDHQRAPQVRLKASVFGSRADRVDCLVSSTGAYSPLSYS